MNAKRTTSSHPARRAMLLTAAVLVAGSVGGCASEPKVSRPSTPQATESSPAASAMPAAPRDEALRLLVKYGLHVDGAPELLREGKLGPGDQGFVLYSDLSESIGLDLASHAGQTAQWYSFPLKQRSAREGSLSAVFVVGGGRIIGAGLHFRRGSPGVAPLNDKGTSGG